VDGASAHVGGGADVDRDLFVDEAGDELGVLQGVDPVPDAFGAQGVESFVDPDGPALFPGVRQAGQPGGAGAAEHVGVLLQGRLDPADTEAHDTGRTVFEGGG